MTRTTQPACNVSPASRARIAALAALALTIALALCGCEQLAAIAPAAPGSTESVDVEAICAQSFQNEEDGFEVLSPSSEDTIEENGGQPNFTAEDLAYAEQNLGYGSYSQLDALGRCGSATACLGPETMPAPGEERESIQEVKPTGWDQAFYDDLIEDGALWNRCHLIAWSLASENANERNLVTGTRAMNAEAMLPYEEDVANYIDYTGNHVLYRATPVFKDQELVCRGILLEAESLEDEGRGICFSLFFPNVQPGVAIDYETGESHKAHQPDHEQAADAAQENTPQAYVLNTSSTRFHKPTCDSVADMNPENRAEVTDTRANLVADGYEPCGSCQP